MNMRALATIVASAVLSTAATLPLKAEDEVSFATNWKAQGGHGGFYQALADGTYEEYGLDVEIVQGGPQVNTRSLLVAGKVDFLLSATPNTNFENSRSDIPTVIVAAYYQRDPQSLMAHPGRFNDIADMTTADTFYFSRISQFTLWPWLRHKYGFEEGKVRQYNYTLAPFLSNPDSVQQSYATAEPLYIDEFEPDVFLLADYGWNGYSNLIETQNKLVDSKPDVVQRFLDASTIGWTNFLYGDNRGAAYELIQADNPEITTEMLDAEVGQILRMQLVDGGEATTKGFGALDLARIRTYHDDMVDAGLYKPGEVDLDSVATDEFVNKGVGLELREELGANKQ